MVIEFIAFPTDQAGHFKKTLNPIYSISDRHCQPQKATQNIILQDQILCKKIEQSVKFKELS